MELNCEPDSFYLVAIDELDIKLQQLFIRRAIFLYAAELPAGNDNVVLFRRDRSGSDTIIILDQSLPIKGDISMATWLHRFKDIQSEYLITYTQHPNESARGVHSFTYRLF